MRQPSLVAAVMLAGCAASGPGRVLADASWNVVVGRADVSLRGLAVVDDRVAWASGSRGTVLRTTDGGVSWQMVGPSVGAEFDFRSVHAFDDRTALAVTTTEPAQVHLTENGGASWRVVLEDGRRGAFFDAMAFADRQRGYVLGDPVDGAMTLFTTSDGGAHWEPMASDSLPRFHDGEAAFAASCGCLWARGDRVVVVTGGTHCRALVSDDRGRNWRQSPLPLQAGRPSTGAFGVAFADANHGVAVGGNYELLEDGAGSIAITTDGGSTWAGVAGRGYRSSVVVLADGRTCIAVGQAGADVSYDAGVTWSRFGPHGFHAVDAASGRAGAPELVLAVGTGGRIARLETVGR